MKNYCTLSVILAFLIFFNPSYIYAKLLTSTDIGDVKLIIIEEGGNQTTLECADHYPDLITNEFTVNIFNGDLLPGIHLPSMFLIAYANNNFDDLIGITEVSFPESNNDDNPNIESNPTSISLEDLSHFEINCPELEHPYDHTETIINFNVTIAFFNDSGSLQRYFDEPLHEQALWPEGAYQVYSDDANVYIKICCGGIYGGPIYGPESGPIDPLIRTDQDSEGSKKVKWRVEQIFDEITNMNKVKTSNLSKLKISPNPCNNLTICNFLLKKKETIEIKILDPNGKIYKNFKFEGKEGYNAIELHISNLYKGLFIVTLSTSLGIWSQKIVKV